MVRLHNNQKRIPLRRGYLTRLREFLEGVLLSEKWQGNTIQVILVDNGYIRELNRKFLKRDEPTDVLAFPLEEPEVYVSVEMARERVKEGDLLLETSRYVLHGILHLLGYNHKNKEQEKILREREESHLAKWMEEGLSNE